MKEVLKQALEALEDENSLSKMKTARDILHKALAQDIPKIGCVNHDCDKCKEQGEPVATARFDGTLHWIEPYGVGLHRIQGFLYTTPQPKQEVSVEVLQAITNAGLTLLKRQHGYELRKLGPAIAHGIKE